MLDFTVITTFSDSGGGGSVPGDGGGTPGGGSGFAQMNFANPDAPTQAEMQRLIRERWHTRPDWWVEGTTPKVLGTDNLPPQFSWNQGSNEITVSSNGGSLIGWDFAITHTSLRVNSGDDIAEISHCKFAPPPVTKAERVPDPGSANPCIVFSQNTNGRIRLISRCWFTVHPDHEGGPYGPSGLIQTNITGSVAQIPTIDLWEYSSLEGASDDTTKLGANLLARGIIYDAPDNVSFDAEQWSGSSTYDRGSMIWGPDPQNYLRISLQNNNTTSPAFGSKDASNGAWTSADPHSDLDQMPASGDQEWVGCFFNRDTTKRRLESRVLARGLVSAMRRNQFGQGNTGFGSHNVHHCMFTEIESIGFGTNRPLSWGGPFRSGTELRVENNWSEGPLWQGSPPNGVIQNNNNTNWDFWNPATLSNISASYSNGALSYGFTASLGGWATVVVTQSSAPMTAKAIVDMARSRSGLVELQIDAESNTAVSKDVNAALASGTYYAHMLYEAGGGIDTLAPVQAVAI